MAQKETVLVTGASGFIAKHVVRELLDAGYRVRASVRSPSRAKEVTSAVAPHLADPSGLEDRLSFVTLDLDRDEGWREALSGMEALVHTASPFPLVQPSDDQEAIRPAVQGTLRALRAAKSAGVNRTILTSSSVAVMFKARDNGRTALDESDWSDLSDPRSTPYVKSKTLAERAAWDFVSDEAASMRLTTINPGFVLGPPLDDNFGTSIKVIQRLLRAKDPMLPNFGFPTVDVRDIAAMHLRALERPNTAGKRFIGGDEFLWFPEMAEVLKAAFPERPIVTRRAPNLIIKFLALFDGEIRTIVPNLDRLDQISADRARRELGIEFRDARESVRAAAQFLISNGLV
ncbi:MAG: SDR family oxidoreductase [Hyphomicrobium sp.]